MNEDAPLAQVHVGPLIFAVTRQIRTTDCRVTGRNRESGVLFSILSPLGIFIVFHGPTLDEVES